MTGVRLLGRAFRLARKDAAASFATMRAALIAEGRSNVDSHFASPSVRRQLKGAMADAQA